MQTTGIILPEVDGGHASVWGDLENLFSKVKFWCSTRWTFKEGIRVRHGEGIEGLPGSEGARAGLTG